MSRPVIALTTDFGPSSHYVAQMKGAILSALPVVRFVDVTHAIAPQSVRHAETVLRSSAFCMPLGTVHVVVVDPGVGTGRRAIACTARGLTFVGPDNGVLGVALAEPDAKVVALDRPELFREPISATFHGRDIFAPVAAELAAGVALEEVGSPIDDAVGSTLPDPTTSEDSAAGEVLAADAFGNLLTNIPGDAIGDGWSVRVGDREALLVGTYEEGDFGDLLALVGSDGYLEVATRNDSAALELGWPDRLPVICRRSGG
jgi:S-adenosylmethionine hydrolase